LLTEQQGCPSHWKDLVLTRHPDSRDLHPQVLVMRTLTVNHDFVRTWNVPPYVPYDACLLESANDEQHRISKALKAYGQKYHT
jgi:hypothetical protein